MTGECVGKLAGFHRSTVRDCSWHPIYPKLVSSSWDGKIVEWEHLHGDSVGERHIHREYSSYAVFPQSEEYVTD